MPKAAMHSHRPKGKNAKGSVKKTQGKKGNAAPAAKTVLAGATKQERRNNAKNRRETKKQAAQRKAQGGATEEAQAPPKIIALVAFHADADLLEVKQRIMDATMAGKALPHTVQHMVLPDWGKSSRGAKQRITVIDAPRDVVGALDCLKCADLLVACFGRAATFENSAFDDTGYELLSALKLQGLPSTFGAYRGVDGTFKAQTEARRFIERYFHSEFAKDDRIFQVDTAEHARLMLRSIAGVTPKPLHWRAERGYLLVDRAEFDQESQRLALCGFARGGGFSAKHLAHLTGHGDYEVDRIVRLEDPVNGGSAASCPSGGQLLAERGEDAEKLSDRLQPYDPTQEEQTWPTAEELASASRGRLVAMPKSAGNTDFEISWVGEQIAEDDDRGMAVDSECGSEGSDFGDFELPEDPAPAPPKFTFEHRAQEDLDFPDEVDTPMETPARDRFQKYRGLKNFRTADWDPKEELPVAYSRIHEFEQFSTMRKESVRAFLEDAAAAGGVGTASQYVCVYLRAKSAPVHPPEVPMVLSSLCDVEHRVTVMHCKLHRVGSGGDAVKSKDEIELHVGFRRLLSRPIYSQVAKQHVMANKTKFERFFHEGTTVNASFYAPTMFGPSPVLAFRHVNGVREMVAWGSLGDADPNRCILKRIVLTGYPFKVHKMKAVVRHMFFNPQDIRWFKKLELVTKNGLRGHITESLGTHGYMKCRFSGFLKHDDTVCIHLYKRVYPGWSPQAWGGDPAATPETA